MGGGGGTGTGGVGDVEGHDALGSDLDCRAAVNRYGRVKADAGVAVLAVVVAEELLAEDPGTGDGPTARGRAGHQFKA